MLLCTGITAGPVLKQMCGLCVLIISVAPLPKVHQVFGQQDQIRGLIRRVTPPCRNSTSHVSTPHRGDRSKQVRPQFSSYFGGLILKSHSGVGFGACERLLEQLSSVHQTDANPQFDIPVESKEVPDERPQWSGLTLIMVCRNMQKAEAACGKLLSYLDRILETRRAKGVVDEYGRNFRQNLVLEIEKCDFTSVKSVVDCARGMRTKSVPRHSFVS